MARRIRKAFPATGEGGSIALEASMLLPWVLMVTFLVLFFALYISQGTLLYYSSSIMAERAAFVWSNSAKDIRTGEYPQGSYDGLYWRLTDDRLVQGLFGLVAGDEGVRVEVGPGMEAGRTGSSPADKLRRAAAETGAVHRVGTGTIGYRNIGIKREVEAEMESVWIAEPLQWLRGGGPAEAGISALIVEPAEFVRTFDLIRYYEAKIRQAPEGRQRYQAQAGEALSNRKR